MRRPRTAALSAIVAGIALLGVSVGGVGAVSRDVAAADEQQQRVEQVRQLDVKDCPFGDRERHRSGTEL